VIFVLIIFFGSLGSARKQVRLGFVPLDGLGGAIDHSAMGFNRRKLEDQRREAAEKEAANRRGTDAQVLEDAERLIAVWNERPRAGPSMRLICARWTVIPMRQ
jgi:hypothetical protein